MDTNFRGLGKEHKFTDSWIHGFKVSSILIKGNLLYIWNQISWFGLTTKTMKIGTPRTIVLSQYFPRESSNWKITFPDPNFTCLGWWEGESKNTCLVEYVGLPDNSQKCILIIVLMKGYVIFLSMTGLNLRIITLSVTDNGKHCIDTIVLKIFKYIPIHVLFWICHIIDVYVYGHVHVVRLTT